ncbi:protein ANTAGONIST OF LIKE HETEROCHROMATIN PROTEIN 1-like [Ixodes scapularis]|uniref:protein ANTAGONIST OF LIKE HETEROCHROMATIN PROTEIN 1-like n=1 Tax=Ixodes scapularis TaxID=6945 RepID=UPI001AD77CEA|nr:protein ANTAGONIST OF LIKE HETEROCHROMATIN PROTEIN 1-like [Ixodes scapularis]
MQVMRDQEPQFFFRFYRMSPQLFDKLHRLGAERLTKQHVVREPITSGERLAMTLRYLSSGNPIMDIAMEFRVGLETAREAIHLTCRVLWEELAPRYMKPPSEQDWQTIADAYWMRWQFPNCLGAVDGKHVQVEAPANSGSLYHNYKV